MRAACGVRTRGCSREAAAAAAAAAAAFSTAAATGRAGGAGCLDGGCVVGPRHSNQRQTARAGRRPPSHHLPLVGAAGAPFAPAEVRRDQISRGCAHTLGPHKPRRLRALCEVEISARARLRPCESSE